MYRRVDDTRHERIGDRIGRVLRSVFQEWVFQAALTGLVIGTVVDGFVSLNQGMLA